MKVTFSSKSIILIVLVASHYALALCTNLGFGKTQQKLGQSCSEEICCEVWLKHMKRKPNDALLPKQANFGCQNSKKDLPTVFLRIAQSKGHLVEVTKLALGSASFQTHVLYNGALGLISSRNWTAVIMQEQSSFLSVDLRQQQMATYPFAKQLVDRVKQLPTRRAIYFATWGYQGGNKGESGLNDDYYKMQARLRAGVVALQQFTPQAEICFVDEAWKLAYTAYQSSRGKVLYDRDDRHPSLIGTYLASLMVYAKVFNQPPSSVSFVPRGISRRNAQIFRNFAQQAYDNLL